MSSSRKPNPRIFPVICLMASVAASTLYVGGHYGQITRQQTLAPLVVAAIIVWILRYALVGDLRLDSHYPRQDMLVAIAAAIILGGVVLYNRSEVVVICLIIVVANWCLARWIIVGPRPVKRQVATKPAASPSSV